MMPAPRSRAGFTMIEITVVSIFLGVLAGIAMPSLVRAVDRAAATKVVTDARILAVAVRSYMEAGGTLPATTDWGQAPTALDEYLQENMAFTFRDAEYRLVTQPAIDDAQLWVRYPAESGLGAALITHRNGTTVTWTPTRTTFFLTE